MTVKLLTEHHLEFLSLKEGYTGSSESTLIKIPHCWKSHNAAYFISVIVIVHGASSVSVLHSIMQFPYDAMFAVHRKMNVL